MKTIDESYLNLIYCPLEELRNIVDHHELNRSIIADSCRVAGFSEKGIDGDLTLAINTASILGGIVGKKEERMRKGHFIKGNKQSIEEQYKEMAPLSLIELKQTIKKHAVNTAIIRDSCFVTGISLGQQTYPSLLAINAASIIGYMAGKRIERKRRKKIDTPVNMVGKFMESYIAWNKLNRSELDMLLEELQLVDKNDARHQIKEQMIVAVQKIQAKQAK